MSSELNMTPRRAPESPMGNVSPSLGSPASENKPKPWPGLVLYGKQPVRMCILICMNILLTVCFCIFLHVAQDSTSSLQLCYDVLYAAGHSVVLNIVVCYKQCNDRSVCPLGLAFS